MEIQVRSEYNQVQTQTTVLYSQEDLKHSAKQSCRCILVFTLSYVSSTGLPKGCCNVAGDGPFMSHKDSTYYLAHYLRSLRLVIDPECQRISEF